MPPTAGRTKLQPIYALMLKEQVIKSKKYFTTFCPEYQVGFLKG